MPVLVCATEIAGSSVYLEKTDLGEKFKLIILGYKPEKLRKESVFLCCFYYGYNKSRNSGWTAGGAFQSSAVKLSKASRV